MRAAILGRYCWGNWAVFFEAATWIILILGGATLASTEGVGHLSAQMGMAGAMLAVLLAQDGIRYHWREAILQELHVQDHAMRKIQEAGEQPDAH
jgi:hypothetical protein